MTTINKNSCCQLISLLLEIMQCDGRMCGQGRSVGGRFLCPHTSLQALHPELCQEWDPENPRGPDQYLPGSNTKVNWICKNNPCGCHKWPAVICSRVGGGRGCPFCKSNKICQHDNLLVLHPEIAKEWDPENITTPDQYPPMSHVKVKWICKNNWCGCHKWEATISNRINGGTNCPFCKNLKICPHNNLLALYPEIAKEWDPTNTTTPDQHPPGSDVNVKWICKNNPCGCHRWEARIYERVGNANRQGRDCPYCANSNGRSCPHYNLLVLYPEIAKEWDPTNTTTPDQYLPGSNIKVKWICKNNPCGCHKWESVIADRTYTGNNCPYCSNKKICLHNSLNFTHPQLCEEWDPANTTTPDKYSYGSNANVKWICKINPCGCHKWEADIKARTAGSNCPYCVNQRICEHNNLKVSHPEICEEWDPANSTLPEQYSYGADIKVKWICKNNSEHKWEAAIYHRTSLNATGCPICNYSKGELECQNILMNLRLQFQTQFRLQSLPEKRFDFAFQYNNQIYLLEYDGLQHFECVQHFHKTQENFIYRRQVDIQKSLAALESGYYIIRIDYSQIDNILGHIIEALKYLSPSSRGYFSDAFKYKYILDHLQIKYGCISILS